MVLRKLAFAAGLAAFALYLWGLLYVLGAILQAEDGGADSSPMLPCRTTNGEEGGPVDPRAAHVVDYSVGFAPLRFDCEMTGGGSYVANTVPGYVNPAVFGLVLASLGCWVAALVVAPPGPRGARGPGG
ncbi:hypothetical protein [Streptomyces prunicolor]|jgi:hypothetical protein|uniref:hypothetical protein n=1 Tax=Streptomyces prunicolor TaxID=67348 RepID=UPI00036FE0AD|nr:hypothetical protein [Streptomyces prunicolor]MCX5238026.1 hypothetical protein [Streptomyces prunicolor]